MPKNIVVIGAGLGGLTSAALLAQKGHKVTVLEQGDWIGGKSRRIEVAGQVIDTGPSLFTFPGVWETFLAKYQELGGKLPKDLEFIRLAEVGRYFFRGDQIDIPVPESHQWHKPWQKFVAEHKALEGPITTLLTSAPMDLKALPALGKLLNVYGTRLSTNNYLNSLSWMPEGLKDLIAIHTLNAGVSPDQTLPIYASMTAIMSEQGISVPRGGMNEVPQLLAKLAEESGAEILLGQRVMSISKHAVKTQERNYSADVVVSSLDASLTDALISGKTAKMAPNRSCSGVAIYAALKKPLPAGTVTHSVVMPDDPADLYRALKSNTAPNQTMSFVNYYEPGHIYSNKKATVAVLLTAPADSADYDIETPWVRDELDRVSNLIGLDRPIDEMFEDYKVLNANYFEGFGALGGALYGAKNPLWQSGPFHNPSYRSLTKPWLYRVGASVHPGGGIPAVMGGAMNSISSLI
ncbi:MAG: phytoene desaturase family protein [Aquiluna sp.]